MVFLLFCRLFRDFTFVAILLVLQIPPSRGGTLVVTVDPADNLTFDDGNGFFYQLKPCAFNSVFPGCWVFDIIDTPCGIRCVEFGYYLEPTASSDQSTYTYTTPERTCRECYCGAEFDQEDSFVSFQYTPAGATFPYTGGFRITTSGSAGTSATIACTPDSAAFRVDCDDATLNWDPRCDQSVSVTLSIAGGRRRELGGTSPQETELAIEERGHDEPPLERDVDATMLEESSSLSTGMPSGSASYSASEIPTTASDTPSHPTITISLVTAAPTPDHAESV